MSAISGYINQIQNAVYGEQVRSSIVSALEQCYADVNSPSLQSEAFSEALNAAYAGGILDIQTVTTIAGMTNQQIIYRYNGTEAGKQKGLYYYSALASGWVLIGSEIQSVSNSNQFTDQNAIYKYTGNQTGMVPNSLYCYNGTAWVPIGSGVLNAATASEMTNTGAIYKYTGSESGYITNGLYYYKGDAWTLLSLDSVVGDLDDLNTIARNSIVSAINEVNDNKMTETEKRNILALLKNAVYSNADAGDRYNAIAHEFGYGADYSVNPFVGNTYTNNGTYIRNSDGVEVTNTNAQRVYYISDFIESDTVLYCVPLMDVPFSQGVVSIEVFAYTKNGLYSGRSLLLNLTNEETTRRFFVSLTKDFQYKIVVCTSSGSAINTSEEIENACFVNVFPLSNELTGYKAITLSGLSKADTWSYSSVSDRYYVKIWDKALDFFQAETLVRMNTIGLPCSSVNNRLTIPVYYPIPASVGSPDNLKIGLELITGENSARVFALTLASNVFTKAIATFEQQGFDSITINERIF